MFWQEFLSGSLGSRCSWRLSGSMQQGCGVLSFSRRLCRRLVLKGEIVRRLQFLQPSPASCWKCGGDSFCHWISSSIKLSLKFARLLMKITQVAELLVKHIGSKEPFVGLWMSDSACRPLCHAGWPELCSVRRGSSLQVASCNDLLLTCGKFKTQDGSKFFVISPNWQKSFILQMRGGSPVASGELPPGVLTFRGNSPHERLMGISFSRRVLPRVSCVSSTSQHSVCVLWQQPTVDVVCLACETLRERELYLVTSGTESWTDWSHSAVLGTSNQNSSRLLSFVCPDDWFEQNQWDSIGIESVLRIALVCSVDGQTLSGACNE